MEKKKNEAVSPVVGVMLMLVVTIIIAAVVSAFASGLADTDSQAPTVTADVRIQTSGTYYGTKFALDVLSVSEPIPTKNLKLTSSYSLSDGTRGGATCLPGVQNVDYTSGTYGPYEYVVPIGYGPGVEYWTTSGGFTGVYVDQHWGNYTWMSGTRISHYPSSSYGKTTPYTYDVVNPTDVGGDPGGSDALTALLGEDWTNLRVGDVVNVKVVHIPSGKTIVDESVVVEG